MYMYMYNVYVHINTNTDIYVLVGMGWYVVMCQTLASQVHAAIPFECWL